MCGIFAFIHDPTVLSPTIPQFGNNVAAIKHRGPDNTEFFQGIGIIMGFNRLAINDLSSAGNQPMYSDDRNIVLICNGEIFNHLELKLKYNFQTKTRSDCEVIIHLYKLKGINMLAELDGDFAFVIYDKTHSSTNPTIYVARDRIGVRPLYIGKSNIPNAPGLFIASEFKAIIEHADNIAHFPPAKYLKIGDSKPTPFPPFSRITSRLSFTAPEEKIAQLLTTAVIKRIHCDTKIGLLISGGLDSSLIASLAVKHKPQKVHYHSFSIGLEGPNASPDLIAAEKVAKFLNTTHHSVTFTPSEGIKAIPEVIRHLETYDITTIRASTPQFLLAKYINENTDVKVLMSGEGSDELFFGYKYHALAPTPQDAQKESETLIKEIHMYDGLRSDRTIAAHSMELRVPFLDTEFVNYVLSIEPSLKMPYNKIEKYILRKAFESSYNSPYRTLPDEILWRRKDAFSDAVGHSWVDSIKTYTNNIYTDEEFKVRSAKYTHLPPQSKEALWYREIFEIYYPNTAHTIMKHFWLPKWTSDEITKVDPSARFIDEKK